MSKYEPLSAYFDSLEVSAIELHFQEIERIVGSSLPPSASLHPAWWGNDESHDWALRWLQAGWRASASLDKQIVSFTREDTSAWTDSELEATVKAYFEMLTMQIAGQPYSQKDVLDRLSESALGHRSSGSIEFSMRGISTVLQGIGAPWLHGAKPRGHVGDAAAQKIRQTVSRMGLLNETDYEPTTSPEELDRRTRNLMATKLIAMPDGVDAPARIETTRAEFARDPRVKAWCLERAKGKCESCSQPAPFVDGRQQPYLELHHVLPLADGGSDSCHNAVAVCPNCHRALHQAHDRDGRREMLFGAVTQLRR